MKLKRSLAGLLAGLLLAVSLTAQTDKLPPINVKQYKLKNGLTVLLHEDHTVPVVAVNVWYHVGSKNESPGRTGFAHLFEHMMFQGSKNYLTDYLGAVEEMGGNVNGTTNEDRTWYFETVPSNFLERALYLEADRMGYLLDAMDQTKLDNQRDVVKNERRQGVDNVPYGLAEEATLEVMYPEGHPYHHSVIGSMDDLSAASLDDVKSFFRTYYAPNNAYVVLSGDFTEKQAKPLIEKYFGKIKPSGTISRPDAPQPQLSSVVRKNYEDPFAQLGRVDLVWASDRRFSNDQAALDVLSSVLTGGRTSRLQSKLIYNDSPSAQSVFARNGVNEIAGTFTISATARPGKSLDDIERDINTEIERLKKDGPTADEVRRAIAGRESSAIFGLQTSFGKGSRIADYAAYLNKPDYFQQDLDRYVRVTPEDVKRVANRYLIANHLVLTMVPTKNPVPPARADKPATTQQKKLDKAVLENQRKMLPKPGADPKFSLPAVEKTTLSNGLSVWLVERHKLPIVAMNLVVNAGGSLDAADKAGLSSLTASMLNQGTKTRSAADISNSLQGIGASVGAGASWDTTGVTMQSLVKDLPAALDIFSDVIKNASFPDKEMTSLKGRLMGSFRQRKANASAVSNVVYSKVLYGDQAYGRQLSGDEKSIQAIGHDDVVKFYESYYRPNNSTLIVVGDVTMNSLKPMLERSLGDWKAGGMTAMKLSDQKMMAKPAIYLVDKPGSAQSSVVIGQVGIDRSNPDYFAVQVMNQILGGGGAARLFMNLREDKGYTYGAYSRFSPRRGAGPFSASAEIQTVSTKEAVQEFLNELNGIRGTRPVTPDELEVNKQSLIRGFPANFETLADVSSQLGTLVSYGLPDSYYNDYIRNINAVTLADVTRVANKYLTPSQMAIVVVGDRKVIEPKLGELGMPIVILDTEGNPITQ
jgi:zinc protease